MVGALLRGCWSERSTRRVQVSYSCMVTCSYVCEEVQLVMVGALLRGCWPERSTRRVQVSYSCMVTCSYVCEEVQLVMVGALLRGCWRSRNVAQGEYRCHTVVWSLVLTFVRRCSWAPE